LTAALAHASATALLAGFSSGALSPVAVAERLLDAAEVAGRTYRHVVGIDRRGALAAAKDSELRWRRGRARPLEGLPFVLKGMIPADGELVSRLTGQGAYLQCTVVPFGFGTPVFYPVDSQPLNPADISRMPGGSSTGSAIALAAGHVQLAVGSDAAGSIRIPAACCEVLGFKPTRGALPKPGGMALSPTLVEAGPMARTIADLSLLFGAMGGGALQPPSGRVRLAIALEAGLDSEAARAFSAVLDALQVAGIELDHAPLPLLAEARAAGWTVLCHEAAAGMAPHLEAIRRSPTSFLKYADRGRDISPKAYQAALVTGEAFAAGVDTALTQFDALITPVAPFALPRADDPELASKTPRIGEMFLPFSLSGHPALVLPVRSTEDVTTSIQLVGRKGGDAALLALAGHLERVAIGR
jgi:Asp-tRNA(Asn)/Glu-tRNA(Gln) amidotransferase A subunit family amidase